jgi:hypothetical protein
MHSYSYIRTRTRTSVSVAALLAAPVSWGAVADRQQARAEVLDHAELLCANCFFGSSDYYYCFAADDKVLIGYQRTPVLNWQDQSKNYLTRVHRGWTVWTPPGQTVPISYDDKHIWVTRTDGKQVKLTQTYSRDIFTHNDRCREAVRAKAP